MHDDVSTEATLENQVAALLPALRRFAMTFERSATDADDLAQDTVVKALSRIHQFQPGTNLKSWLFTIMRNTYCSKYQLRKRCRLVPEAEMAKALDAMPSMQEWVLRMAEVQEAIASLDTDKRRVLLMATRGETYERMACVCDCNIGTIKSRVFRARNAVMALLGETSHSDAVAIR